MSQAEKYGLPNSLWLMCQELDPVMRSMIHVAAHRTDRALKIWLNAVNPLMYVASIRTE